MYFGWRVIVLDCITLDTNPGHKPRTQTLTMERFCLCFLCFCLVGEFNLVLSLLLRDAPTLGSKNSPRLVTDAGKIVFNFEELQNHTVFYYAQDNEDLYVGGTDFVLRLNTSSFQIIENITAGPLECHEHPCQKAVTVIEELDGRIFVCGTNGRRPKCWSLPSAEQNTSLEVHDGLGISPVQSSHNSLSLTVEGDLYAAAPTESDGGFLQFRRKAGKRTPVWMYNSWVLEPTFISASLVKRENDSDNEKIYVFFREKNTDTNPEADHVISRVARVCKVDEGGSKRFFQNMWTTFIKARLVCGFPDQSLYFNRLQDTYVLHDSNWNNTRVYTIFTSSWNSTAVCIYTIGMIENVFENSPFKGHKGEIPTPRPGKCVKNSKTLPLATVSIVKDYPEMANWVHSVHYKAPFYVSSYNYTKIVVDQVQGANNSTYNVLLLATDSGKIHKVLEAGSQPVVISETQLQSRSSVETIKLDSKKRKLMVGFSDFIATVDLQKCEHRSSCEDCVLAQDPYCAWSKATAQCVPTALGNIQNVMTGNPDVCSTRDTPMRTKREAQSSSFVHQVPLNVPFYLSCPIDSYHAEYSWKLKDHQSPCLQMGSHCLHLIPSMAEEHYGNYRCVSQEQGYTKVMKQYHLEEQNLTTAEARKETRSLNNASPPAPQVWLTLALLLAAL